VQADFCSQAFRPTHRSIIIRSENFLLHHDKLGTQSQPPAPTENRHWLSQQKLSFLL